MPRYRIHEGNHVDEADGEMRLEHGVLRFVSATPIGESSDCEYEPAEIVDMVVDEEGMQVPFLRCTVPGCDGRLFVDWEPGAAIPVHQVAACILCGAVYRRVTTQPFELIP